MKKYIFISLFPFLAISCQEDSSDSKNVTSSSEDGEARTSNASAISNRNEDTDKESLSYEETENTSETGSDAASNSEKESQTVTTNKDSEINKTIGGSKADESFKKTEKENNLVQNNDKISENKDEGVEAENEANSDENLHDSFDEFLKKYVSKTGKVNYKEIKQNKSELNNYLKTLKDNPVQNSWSRNKKLAYWINAYNAFTIKRIIDNYPLNSIMDLDGGKTWDVKWIKIGNKTYSLNQIEHDIIRPQFKDARIHFAVNCAAKSCPPLYNRAYNESNINSYLEKRTKQFINDKNYNQISADKAQVSKIFEWYKEDFGDLRSYINKYSNTNINSNVEIKFKEYDWSLNE